MCKKMVFLISFVLVLGAVSHADNIVWTAAGVDALWSTADNWDLGRAPTLSDEVRIDVPAAADPNGPIIQEGIDAQAKGIFTEAAGAPTLTMTGGTLEVAEWIWWGDGTDSFAVWMMSGGVVTVANEFELGWDGGAGTVIMTDGTINAGEAVIPTDSGAFGELYLYGGTYNVTKPDGLTMNENGLIEITEGTLVVEGDERAKINDLIAAGAITSYEGVGLFKLEYDIRNPGKTTLTAFLPEPKDPGVDGLVAYYPLDNDANDMSGNALHGTIVGDPNFVESPLGMALMLDGVDDYVDLGDPNILDFGTGDFTISSWINMTSNIVGAIFAKGGDESAGIRYSLNMGEGNGNKITLTTDDDVTKVRARAGTVVNDGLWHHVVAMRSGTTLLVYVDGKLDGTDILPDGYDLSGTSQANAYIGAITDYRDTTGATVEKFFNGTIDEVAVYGRALSFGEVRYLAGDRVAPVDPGTEDLVAYYPLDNDANDASGNGHNGTITGDPNWVDGKIGAAIEFDEVDDDVVVPDFVYGPEFTIAFWFKTSNLDGASYQYMFSHGAYNVNSSVNVYFIENEETYYMTPGVLKTVLLDADDVSYSVEVVAGYADGEWHYYTLTVEAGVGANLYLDGISKVARAPLGGDTFDPITDIYLGARCDRNAVRRYGGALDEVAIYDRALSTGEILFLIGER